MNRDTTETWDGCRLDTAKRKTVEISFRRCKVERTAGVECTQKGEFMSDVFIIEDRARTAISLGESHFREFKSAYEGVPGKKQPRNVKDVSRDIAEALVAFANADGGELLIGVEDDGTISGTNGFNEQQIAILENAPSTHVHAKTPLPKVRTAQLNLGSERILYFSVSKSTTHVHQTTDGRCLKRRDLETIPIPAEEILFDRQEQASRAYDREFLDGATADALDKDLVRAVAEQMSPGMSVEKCLQYLDLAEYVGYGLRLRRAALLLFAREPQRWHPRLQIRILKVQGTEVRTGDEYNVVSDNSITGNVLQLIETGWDNLRPHLVQTRLARSAKFESTVMYPELACRETLVNAIAHRDYSDEGRGIEIYVFQDRMEVVNPGALLSTIKLEELMKLEGLHQSRNAFVTRVLKELGYMRELGEGIRRIFDLMKKNELTAPDFHTSANSFRVTLHHKPIYSAEELLWLGQFSSLDLNREQKALVVLGRGGTLVAPQDIWDNLGIVDTERYRQLVSSLQKLRILKSEVPKAQAQTQAKHKRLSVRKIPRFKIIPPSNVAAYEKSRLPVKAVQPQDDLFADSPDPQARIWLGNLSDNVTEQRLIDFLSEYGTVEDLYLPTIRGKNKGFAFAEFDSPEIAREVMDKVNGIKLDGKPLVVRRAFERK